MQRQTIPRQGQAYKFDSEPKAATNLVTKNERNCKGSCKPWAVKRLIWLFVVATGLGVAL